MDTNGYTPDAPVLGVDRDTLAAALAFEERTSTDDADDVTAADIAAQIGRPYIFVKASAFRWLPIHGLEAR